MHASVPSTLGMLLLLHEIQQGGQGGRRSQGKSERGAGVWLHSLLLSLPYRFACIQLTNP